MDVLILSKKAVIRGVRDGLITCDRWLLISPSRDGMTTYNLFRYGILNQVKLLLTKVGTQFCASFTVKDDWQHQVLLDMVFFLNNYPYPVDMPDCVKFGCSDKNGWVAIERWLETF